MRGVLHEDAQIWKGLYRTATEDGPAATGEEDSTGTTFRVYAFDGYEERFDDD